MRSARHHRDVRRRQQRNHARLLRAGEHHQRAGIGQGVIGAGDADIGGGAERAQFLAIGDAGAHAGQAGDAALGQEGRVGGHRGLAGDGRGHHGRTHRGRGRRGRSCRPALRRAFADGLAMRASQIHLRNRGCATGGGSASGLPGAAAQRRCARGAGCCRATSAPPPHLAEAAGRRRAADRAGSAMRAAARRSSARARANPAAILGRAPRPRPAGRPSRTSAGCVISQAKARKASLSRRLLLLARLGLLDLRAQVQQHLGNVDLHRADFGARAAQAGGERQRRLVRDAHELRRDDGADRPRIDPRKTVAADLAVHRAGVQAGAAADAIERLALGCGRPAAWCGRCPAAPRRTLRGRRFRPRGAGR